MRILIKTRFGQLIIKEVSEATINEDGDIVFPKSREKYLAVENAEEVFKSLLEDGYADLSEFKMERYRCDTLL